MTQSRIVVGQFGLRPSRARWRPLWYFVRLARTLSGSRLPERRITPLSLLRAPPPIASSARAFGVRRTRPLAVSDAPAPTSTGSGSGTTTGSATAAGTSGFGFGSGFGAEVVAAG